MKKSQLERARNFIKPYRITSGKGFRLKHIDPGDTAGPTPDDKGQAKEVPTNGVEWLSGREDKPYTEDTGAVAPGSL